MLMKQIQQFTAIIEREEDGYVALCPELDIASQGDSVESAKQNLTEALELFLKLPALRRFKIDCIQRVSLLDWKS